MKRFLLIASVVSACGGHVTSGDDSTLLDSSARDVATDQDPLIITDQSAPQNDAMTFDAHVYDDAGPPTCGDVGRYPGESSCCNGEYCTGACWAGSEAGHFCVCSSQVGGCAWPLVCCLNPDGCVSASSCKKW